MINEYEVPFISLLGACMLKQWYETFLCTFLTNTPLHNPFSQNTARLPVLLYKSLFFVVLLEIDFTSRHSFHPMSFFFSFIYSSLQLMSSCWEIFKIYICNH